MAVFIDWRNLHVMIDAVQVAGWSYQGLVVWDKTQACRPRKGWWRSQAEYIVLASKGRIPPEPDGKCSPGVIRCPIVRDRQHAAQKPVRLLADLINASDRYKTILDPFAGSGSTLVAGRRLKRRVIGVECEKHYCDVAADRLAQLARGPS